MKAGDLVRELRIYPHHKKRELRVGIITKINSNLISGAYEIIVMTPSGITYADPEMWSAWSEFCEAG